jgi:hypothetical protein
METSVAELSPAPRALNLDDLIGGVSAIVSAASRFDTLATTRSTTTCVRYRLKSRSSSSLNALEPRAACADGGRRRLRALEGGLP